MNKVLLSVSNMNLLTLDVSTIYIADEDLRVEMSRISKFMLLTLIMIATSTPYSFIYIVYMLSYLISSLLVSFHFSLKVGIDRMVDKCKALDHYMRRSAYDNNIFILYVQGH